MADALDLGSNAERRGSSNLSGRTERKEGGVRAEFTVGKIDRILAKIKPHPVIALVDDDLSTLDLLERILREEKYRIHHFKCAEDFLEEFSEVRPDVVIMEAILPGTSGLSALTDLRIKSSNEIIPVLILSTKSDPRAKALAFRKGAWDYLVRPFDADELAARVRSLIRARAHYEMLRISSISDPLTSVYNRRFLIICLEKEIERVKRYSLDLACLWIDLDGFRRINEQEGERFGDFVLQEFASLLVKNSRSVDLIGRIQNDDFLLLLCGTRKEQAVFLIQRLRCLVERHAFQWNGRKVNPTFCVGVTGCSGGELSEPAFLLARAEEAITKAKAVGVGETAVLGVYGF